MCTSILQIANDGTHVFSRTMDWNSLQAGPVFVPREYRWRTDYNDRSFQNKYGILGTGRKKQFEFDISDGINECGLSVQKLTFSHGAKLNQKLDTGNVGLAPFELPFYLLGKYKSIKEIITDIANIQLMSGENAVRTYENPHLHYAITDRSGQLLILETDQNPMKMIVNNYGVVTNAADFEKQAAKLVDYLNIRSDLTAQRQVPQRISNGSFAGKKVPSSSYTPTGRFLRAVYYRERTDIPENEAENFVSSWHILNSVVVPKSKKYQANYTVYRTAFCLETRRYFFESYNSLLPIEISLSDEMLLRKEAKIYEVNDSLALK
ncbi:linear amide C-N hydrolase [Liquorilactobacillus mali]|uniref:Penicillin V acylase related amidase n=1 Tax=Liquorilactobacillus mali TaxID=1618 RepID=A0A0R2FWA4_9LACO|nr:linear amide C-N hydrolase [Liquorilactobacillus mali]KRN29799.1 penicillin V acylase related amidase [Liquorilactobacillus mali]